MILDDNIEEYTPDIQLTDKEVFTKIWLSPREVFQFIDDKKYEKYLSYLLILGGISNAFDNAASESFGDSMSLLTVIGVCIFVGGVLGWISFYIYAALISWTGKWINGQGDTASLLRMTAHSMVPAIVALVLLIPQIAIGGNAVFQSAIDISETSTIESVIFYSVLFLELVLGIWTLVLFVIGISVVQRFSIGKSILNMILPILVILIPIVALVFILGDVLG